MNSTGLVGSHAANAGETPATPRAKAVEINAPFNFIFIMCAPVMVCQFIFGLFNVSVIFKQDRLSELDCHQLFQNRYVQASAI
jgi:hypothetical protein